MDIDYHSMIKIISQTIWPIGRFSGLVLTAPIFSSSLIPRRIKITFIFILSFVCSYLVPDELSFQNFHGFYFIYIIQELAFGVLMGFVLQLVHQVFIIGGQIISMQAGLGFAVMVDPMSKASVPLVSQIFSYMFLLIFLGLNGHVALLEALINSFKVMPIGSLHIDSDTVWKVLMFSSWMFKEAVLISIPAIISLLLVNLSFGIITRVTPQLNIFALGFPITLLMGIAIIYICMPSIGAQMVESLELGMHLIIGIFH